MAMPSPPSTRGKLSFFAYTRKPGLDTRRFPGSRALLAGPCRRDHQVLADLGVADLEAADVALLLKDLGEVRLDLGVRHAHRVLVSRIRVPQTGQHVCDRVSHRHGLMALLTAVSLRDLRRGRWARWLPGRSAGARPACAQVLSWCRAGYQLDLVMPGRSPRWAMVRKQTRHSPNLRYTARQAHSARTWWRTPSFRITSRRRPALLRRLGRLSPNANRPAADVARPSSLVAGRDHGHVHAARPWRSTWSGLISMEHQLLSETEGVVAPAVELPVGQPAEVTDTGQRKGEQAVELTSGRRAARRARRSASRGA